MLDIAHIRNLIEYKGLNKRDLSTRCGISRVTLDKILDGGEVNISTIVRFAQGLGVRVGELFSDYHDPNQIRTTGDNSPTSYSGDISVVVGDQHGCSEVFKLLLAEKDKRIEELTRVLREKENVIQRLCELANQNHLPK